MKTNKSVATGIGLMAVAIMVMLFTACSSRQCEDYETVIPKEADAVAAVRVNSLLDKSGMNRNPLIKMAVKNAGGALGEGMGEKLVELFKDPSLSGIDFDKPVYVFKVGDALVGLTAKVDDESLVDEFVKMLTNHNLCSKTKEEDGMKWGTVLDEISMVYSDNTLLLLADMSGASKKQTDKMLRQLMELDEEDSFVATEQFANLKATEKDDIRVYGNMAALPGDKGMAAKMLNEKLMGVLPQEAEMVIGAQFNNGSLDVNTRFFSRNEKLQAEIDKKFAMLKPISGKYTDKIDGNAGIYVCFGANGPLLLEEIKSMPELKESLLAANMGIDLDNMIRAIDGDVLLMRDEAGEGDKSLMGQILMYAQLGNTDFMKDVDYWQKSAMEYGISLNSVGKNQYKLSGSLNDDDHQLGTKEIELYWTVDDNELYFGPKPYAKLQMYDGHGARPEMEGQLLYMSLKDTNGLAGYFDSMVITSSKSGELNLKLNLKSITGNILGALVENIWN